AQIDGGAAAILRVAGEAGRLNVVNWGPAPGAPDFWRRMLTDPNIVWVAVLNGLVGSMAAFGTDHDLMQRLLTVETRRESQWTLSLTPLGTLATLAIYLRRSTPFTRSTRSSRCRARTRSCRTSSA